MNDPSVAIDILPYIQKKKPDGTTNSEKIQVAALLAISVLKPNDFAIYDTVRKRIYEEPNYLNSMLFERIKTFYKNYAKMMVIDSEQSLSKNDNSNKWEE